jgi:hypothetical protein
MDKYTEGLITEPNPFVREPTKRLNIRKFKDRVATLAANHHFDLECLFSDLVGEAATKIAEAHGGLNLGNAAFIHFMHDFENGELNAETKAILGKTIVKSGERLLHAKEECVDLLCGTLGYIDEVMRDLLKDYSHDLDEERYPRDSFARWLRRWSRQAAECEAAE